MHPYFKSLVFGLSIVLFSSQHLAGSPTLFSYKNGTSTVAEVVGVTGLSVKLRDPQSRTTTTVPLDKFDEASLIRLITILGERINVSNTPKTTPARTRPTAPTRARSTAPTRTRSTAPVGNRTIQTSIKSRFRGFKRGNVYEFQNGQMWEQTDFELHYHYAYQPSVIVYRDGAKYMMKVQGIDRAVEVRSIKAAAAGNPAAVGGQVMKSSISSDFEGFDQGNIYKLLNGQIWQQTEFHIHIHIAVFPQALIYKDGTQYKMKVEGIDHAVAVKRIK